MPTETGIFSRLYPPPTAMRRIDGRLELSLLLADSTSSVLALEYLQKYKYQSKYKSKIPKMIF